LPFTVPAEPVELVTLDLSQGESRSVPTGLDLGFEVVQTVKVGLAHRVLRTSDVVDLTHVCTFLAGSSVRGGQARLELHAGPLGSLVRRLETLQPEHMLVQG
jgi:hypothetical protein